MHAAQSTGKAASRYAMLPGGGGVDGPCTAKPPTQLCDLRNEHFPALVFQFDTHTRVESHWDCESHWFAMHDETVLKVLQAGE